MNLAWYMEFLLIEEGATLVPSVCPNVISLVPLGNELPLWPPPVSRRQPVQTHIGWSLLLAQQYAALDDDDDDDDDGGQDMPIEDESDVESSGLDADLGALMLQIETHDSMVAFQESEQQLERSAVVEAEAGEAHRAIAASSVPDTNGEASIPGNVQGDVVGPEQVGHVGEPLAPQQVPMPRAFLGRLPAEACMVTTGGKLSFYANTGNFEARCSKHPSCVLTRTSKRGPRSNGRPLGMLQAWLNMDTPAELHKDKNHCRVALTLAVRQAAREEVKSSASGTLLCEHEWPLGLKSQKSLLSSRVLCDCGKEKMPLSVALHCTCQFPLPLAPLFLASLCFVLEKRLFALQARVLAHKKEPISYCMF